VKAFSGLLIYLGVILLLAASAFIAITITTGHSLRFWEDTVALATVAPTIEPTVDPAENQVEINFVFCDQSNDGTKLTADVCTPLAIRRDSKVYIQMANGSPITIDGFPDVNTGFKITMDSGDTVMAVSIENPYFSPITFGESTLKLQQVAESRTVYLPLAT
jgi:hypothetical protein